ncbi:MAG: type II secretion system protein GspG [Deltaproteobacteria bacterium]|nr:type II secretion system protein GspG [Deltaproteobacteria bacterium]
MMTKLANEPLSTTNGFLARLRAAAMRRHSLRDLRKADAGMTLLEVLIVLALISLIAGAIGVTVFANFKRGQIKTAKLMVNEVRGAVQQYMSDNSGDCPPNIEELVNQKFLKKSSTKDPWGKPFTLKCPGEQDSDGVDITSPGPDKQEGTEDDILSWK